MISLPNVVKTWTLDIRKMSRPERSGVLANLIVYALLWGWGYALIPHDFGDGFNLKCYLAPWECPKQPDEYSKEEIAKKYRIIFLGPGKGKKPCTCHIDVHYYGTPILHLHTQWEFPCDDSFIKPEEKEWQKPHEECFQSVLSNEKICMGPTVFVSHGVHIYDGYTIHENEGEYRWHCEPEPINSSGKWIIKNTKR